MNLLLRCLPILALSACSSVTGVEPAPPAETAEAFARRGSRWPCATAPSCCTPAGRQSDALADIALAAELKPEDMRTVGALRVIRVAAERSDAGLADCDRALALPGSKANAYTSLGQALLLLGRHAEAVAAFNGALSFQANHMRALYGRGLARQAAGETLVGQIDMNLALKYLPGAGREFASVKPPVS